MLIYESLRSVCHMGSYIRQDFLHAHMDNAIWLLPYGILHSPRLPTRPYGYSHMGSDLRQCFLCHLYRFKGQQGSRYTRGSSGNMEHLEGRNYDGRALRPFVYSSTVRIRRAWEPYPRRINHAKSSNARRNRAMLPISSCTQSG